jgi:hypothetical protein
MKSAANLQAVAELLLHHVSLTVCLFQDIGV